MALRDLLFGKGLNDDAINQGLWSVQVGVGDVAYPPGLSLYEGIARDYLTIYRTQPAVRFVIDFIARNVAQVPMKAYRRKGDTDRETLSDHPFSRFMAAPNREATSFELMRDIITDLCIYDVIYYPKTRADGLLSLTRWYPDAVTFEGGDSLAPAKFVLHNPDGTTITKNRPDVFWMHGYGSRRGIPPMESLRRILAEDDAAGRHRESAYKNGLRQAGVIERPLDAPAWDSTARKNFRDSIRDRYSGGANAGKPLVLEEGMTWKGDAFEARDAEYISSRTFTMTAVAHAFHVSPQMLGIESAAYASVAAYHNYLYTDTLAPTLTFLEQGFEKQILPEFDDTAKVYVEFKIEEKLRGSFEEQAAAIQSAVQGPYMTPNEIRAMRNLPPVEGGDVLYAAPNTPGGFPGTPTAGPEPPAGQTPKALKSKAMPGDRGAVKRRDAYAAELEKTLTGFFDRQRRQVKALKGRDKASLPSPARWRRELAKDLRPSFERFTVAEGKRKAAQLGGDYDAAQTQHYLDAGADNVAKNVNDTVVDALAEDEDVDHVFGAVLVAVAARVALGQASHLMGFAREEAAKQNGAATKVWTVVSSKSRHPEMNGEVQTVGLAFSNGMAYPGDPAGSVDQTAGCQCLLDIEAAPEEKAITNGHGPPINVSVPLTVNIPESKTTVEAAQIHVAPADVTVSPPDVNVTVEPAQVTVTPSPPVKTRKVVKRNKAGQIESLEEAEV